MAPNKINNSTFNILSLLCLVMLFWCCNDKNNYAKVSSVQSEIEKSKKKVSRYFPDSLVGGYNDWFTEQLIELEEPNISKYEKNIEAYRLTIIPTFGSPLSIRMEIKNNNSESIYFFAKSHSGSGGYSPKNDSLILDAKKIFNNQPDIWVKLNSKVMNLDFWNQQMEAPDHHGRDGTEYLIEGFKDGKYQFIHRFIPTFDGFKKSKEFVELASLMLSFGEGEYLGQRSKMKKQFPNSLKRRKATK